VGETNVTDRRVERANRTRDNVVDALLALIDEGNLRPTAREIAARANVSLRSLYVHFDDVDALFHAAALRHKVRLDEALPELVTSGTFEERLKAFVERRSIAYELGRRVNHAALLAEPFSPAMRSIISNAWQTAITSLEKAFAAELTGRQSARKRAALDVMTGGGTWESLRHHHNLSVDEAAEVVCDMVRAYFGQDRSPQPSTRKANAGRTKNS
jgi:AcrR family transcriptional regulator